METKELKHGLEKYQIHGNSCVCRRYGNLDWGRAQGGFNINQNTLFLL